jgi:hypothetical protein
MVPSSLSSTDASPDISSPSSNPFHRKNTVVREYSIWAPAVRAPKANSAHPSRPILRWAGSTRSR